MGFFRSAVISQIALCCATIKTATINNQISAPSNSGESNSSAKVSRNGASQKSPEREHVIAPSIWLLDGETQLPFVVCCYA